MNSKLKILPLILGVTALAFCLVATSCKGKTRGDASRDKAEAVSPDEQTMEQIKNAEKVFNALPTPLEVAQLMKEAGARFDATLLNPVENKSNYTSSKSMALNLGTYVCDLSFASMYDETSLLVNYMEAAEDMATGLGILDAIDETTVERLEQNINNRDVIMEIVSETFLNSQAYLEDDEQHAVAATIIAGGFIEGLYISTRLVDMKNYKGNKLVQTIADQKMSVDDMIRLLETYTDNTAIRELLGPIHDLKAIFDKIERSTTPSNAQYNEKIGMTEITGAAKSDMKQEVFLEIRDKVAEIRNSYVN
ncbi:MAG TPA: hypothetical protein PK005_00800 [Bacteroidales bacterium]|jgi:hypothetical protein|nr:hypothetical protein [Bacteroidales bacterium]MDI9532117.1 hypothetical protein [Bacteroidota bacterium]OPZ57700.1 MAG: hypothetical protein BWY89_00482 [Bacteroidetes bacterium ADurb.BinA012]MBP7035176.1 hypothetical protein [Bacteroidales bacterium]MBP8708813.1 hypothetical protein [Bacteroidales bacterium]